MLLIYKMEFVSGDLYKRHIAVEGLTYEEGYLLPINGNVNIGNATVCENKTPVEF